MDFPTPPFPDRTSMTCFTSMSALGVIFPAADGHVAPEGQDEQLLSQDSGVGLFASDMSYFPCILIPYYSLLSGINKIIISSVMLYIFLVSCQAELHDINI